MSTIQELRYTVNIVLHLMDDRGGGCTYMERQRERVRCPECGDEMVVGSLLEHPHTQNGWGGGDPSEQRPC